ncbi:MAG: carboxylesterase family protein [Gammaproteobacteria bacterium]|nr:carboxylesterase family protein [Gammaproteobacteria bacterium]
MKSGAALMLLGVLAGPLPAADAPVVMVQNGALQGVSEAGIERYLGIPYAAPPVGELRWRPPQPAADWDGRRAANSHGHACPQVLGKYKADWPNDAMRAAGLSEDCLTLNIWTPAGRNDGALLPVMFYIHGGNMQYGSNVMPLYDGTVLARSDVVVVIINYRLGYLGRFGHPVLSRLQSDEPLVNYGLQDQVAALEWVQRNIKAFGGDPGNVTIFGHSAGGVSVNWLMVTRQSENLFHKAIAMGSGVLLDRNQHITDTLPRGLTGLSSEQVGSELAEYFAISGSDSEVAAQLRALDWQQLVDYQDEVIRPFNPVVDGRLAHDHIAAVFERGEQHDVPYLAGANSWESNQIEVGVPLIGQWFLGGALIEGLSDADLAIFDDQWTRIGIGQRWFAEGLFLTSTRYLGKQMANVSSPAWLYRTDYQQTAVRGQFPGSVHGLEMPYVFGRLEEHPEYQRPPEAAAYPPSAEDLRWGDTVRGYWLNMAKHGNPNGEYRGRELPAWPEYRPDSDLTMVLNENFEPVAGLDKVTLDSLEQRALIRRAEYAAVNRADNP